MWTYPEHWAIEGMATETAAGVRTFHDLVNKGSTPLNSPVDLPVKLTSNLSRAALVGRAALTIFNVGALGLTAYTLYNYLQDDGITETGGIIQSGQGCIFPGSNQCPQYPATSFVGQSCTDVAGTIAVGILSAGCFTPANTFTIQQQTPGAYIYFKKLSTTYGVVSIYPGLTSNTNTTPTKTELEIKINSTPTTNTDLYNALKADSSKPGADSSFPFFVMNTARTDIEATPHVTPSQVVSTESVPMPDGSTETISIEEAYAYYPTLSGINADTGLMTSTPVQQNPFTGQLQPVQLTNLESGSEEIDYQTFTQTNTTTTNNTTGQTNTTTTQTNHGTGLTTVINNNTTNNTNTDICIHNPSILACQILDAVPPATPETVPTQNVGDFSMPASVSGSCPAPYTQTLTTGQNIAWSYEPVCTFGSSIRPVVIALALLAAAYIVSGAVRSPA